MIFIDLNQLTQISGITALVNALIGFLFGGIVLYKSIKTKQRMVFFFFLTIVFTLSPWFPAGLGYFYWLLTGQIIPYQLYVLVGTIGIPIAIMAWLDIYISTIMPKIRKFVLIVYGVFSIIFEIYLFYFLFFAPGAPVESLLGVIVWSINPLDIDYKGFLLIYLGISIFTSCITGIHFAITSMKIEENKKIIWKGRFLLLSFSLFGFGAVFDAIVEMTAIFLIIIRIILILSTFFFYLGFILPKWAQKVLAIYKEKSK
jgi:hypothetical protein